MRSRVTLPASRTARGPAKRETLHSSVDSVGSTRMSQRSGSADSGPVRNAVRPPGWERRPQLCRRRLREPGKAASAPWASARVGWGSLVGAVWVCARCPVPATRPVSHTQPLCPCWRPELYSQPADVAGPGAEAFGATRLEPRSGSRGGREPAGPAGGRVLLFGPQRTGNNRVSCQTLKTGFK